MTQHNGDHSSHNHPLCRLGRAFKDAFWTRDSALKLARLINGTAT